jgi:predicted DsbA family dithiol-disulfide isomerase
MSPEDRRDQRWRTGPLVSRVPTTYVSRVKKLLIDIWSDIACPWCYVGKRRLEAALALFPHRADVEVTWRAFELDPAAPPVRDAHVSHAERIAKKYGMSVAKAEAAMKNLTEVAAADGLEFHFEKTQSGNTFDAHRVLHLALERGVQDAVKERLLRGYMTEGVAIGVRDELVTLASEAGLDLDEVRAMLDSSRYSAEVRADEEQAAALGISGVPFFVIGGRYAVSGAQPTSALLEALERAWGDVNPDRLGEVEGAACGPDGCA